MFRSSTGSVLVRLFAWDFIRSNSGFLVSLFGILLSYMFFINTVGDVNLITHDELRFYQFIFVMTFITSPVMTILISILYVIYSVKSCLYILKSLSGERHAFLFYSVSSLSRLKHFECWLLVQLAANLPLFVFCAFALVFGCLLGHLLLPLLTLLFLLLLSACGALLYMRRINSLHGTKMTSWRIGKGSLGLQYLLYRQKRAIVVVKGLSLALGVFIWAAFSHSRDLRVAGFFILTVAVSHFYLFVKHHQFTEEFFALDRNLPVSRLRRLLVLLGEALFLISPELVWLFYEFKLVVAGEGVLFGAGIVLLLRVVLYVGGISLKRLFQLAFVVYFVFLFLILYQQTLLLAASAGVCALVVFYRSYYAGGRG